MTIEKFKKAHELMSHIDSISNTIESYDRLLTGDLRCPVNLKFEFGYFFCSELKEKLENKTKELFLATLKEDKKLLIEEKKKLQKEFDIL